jgi:acetyl-CoA carboxylase biotin carboxyl carrier protein
VIGRIRKNGRDWDITAPNAGIAATVAAGHVEYGSELVVFGEVGLPEGESHGGSAQDAGQGTLVRAETDGTVWLKASPSAPLYAPVGSLVVERGTLALVEVMKTFTPVRSPVAGEVVAVLVENGASVAAGQGLFRIG